MDRKIIYLVVLWIALVWAQVVVFNHISLWNVAVPLVFIYLLLRLPVSLNANWVLTIGFFTGLTVDMFSDTYGLNALCCTLLCGVRRPLLRLYVQRVDDINPPEPSMLSMGVPAYLKYLLTATLLYCLMMFLVEGGSFFPFYLLVLRVVCSTILSAAIMAGIDVILNTRK